MKKKIKVGDWVSKTNPNDSRVWDYSFKCAAIKYPNPNNGIHSGGYIYKTIGGCNRSYGDFRFSTNKEICMSKIVSRIKEKDWFNDDIRFPLEIKNNVITIHRDCCPSVYKNSDDGTKRWNLDRYFIEIIRDLLVEHGIKNIGFIGRTNNMGGYHIHNIK